MSYSPVSAGYAAHEEPRGVEQGSINEKLVVLAEEWLDKRNYRATSTLAHELTTDVRTTAACAGLLAIHPRLTQHATYEYLGEFISCLWNERCPETTIVYPHETPGLIWLGNELAPQKMLIIQGDAGRYFGMFAQGPIIIANDAGKEYDWYGTGPNNMLTPTCVYKHARGERRKKVVDRWNGPLKEYVDRLIALAQGDPFAIEAMFGDGNAINRDVKLLTSRRRWNRWRSAPRPWEAAQ